MEILRNKVVLLVAADGALRDSLAAELRTLGAQPLQSSGGFEAFESCRERRVDLILCAARLASGTPFQLLSDVRRTNYEIPLILLAAAGEGVSQTEALHRGFFAYYPQAYPGRQLFDASVRALEFVDSRRKKKVERVSVAGQVKLCIGGVEVEAPVMNLSRGGMFVSLEQGFPLLHSVLEFRLTMTQGPQPELGGKALVRWVRERQGAGHLPGVGLEFTEISESARAFLNAYVERSAARA